jgi:uncharacterized ion transporter superfamily protein YfcC
MVPRANAAELGTQVAVIATKIAKDLLRMMEPTDE